jgi:hypothetical protein
MARFAGEHTETFTLDVPLERARAHFRSFDNIVANFGQLERHEKLDDDTLRFLLLPQNALGATFRGKYDCRYSFPSENVLAWKTVSADANIFADGSATFTSLGASRTRVVYTQKLEMEIPVNRLVGRAIAPLVKREIVAGVKAYLDRMRRAL